MSKPVDLLSHSRYRPDVVGLACGKVTAARAELSIAREDFGKALAHLLGWAPSAEIIEQWEICAAPPPGDVITAVGILTTRINTNATKPENLDYVSLLLSKRKLSRDRCVFQTEVLAFRLLRLLLAHQVVRMIQRAN